MDNRISSTSTRPALNNNHAGPANNAAKPANNATLNTTDATSFTTTSAPSTSLQDIADAVKELEARITELEDQVFRLGRQVQGLGSDPTANGPDLPPGVSLPPFPGAPANDLPPTDLPANNLPTNNLPTNNLPTSNLPANNAPVNNAPANNAPANNAPANNAPTDNAPANNAPADNASPATSNGPAPAGTIQSELRRMLDGLKKLQAQIQKRIADLEKLLRGSEATPDDKAMRDELARQAAGLEAVSHVLRQAKLTGLTPEEEKIVRPALKRVHEIGRLIGQGDNPNQYAAELFALRHTLQDPSSVGSQRAVTHAAQVVGVINDYKTDLQEQLAEYQAAEEAGGLPAEAVKEKAALEARIKGLVGIEKALDEAKLTRLNRKGEDRAIETIARLGEIADGIGSGSADPASVEDEVFRLGQALKNPNGAPQTQSVEEGAAVIKQISDAKAAIHERLRDIDEQVMGGAAPEKYAGERARLMERAEALHELGAVVSGVKMEQSNPKARQTVKDGLQSASKIAKALADGESPNQFRAEVFVLKQTFQEPIPSRDNAAVQAGAAALQMIGRAEARVLKRQEEIASTINRGADARKFDDELAELHRQHEDLEFIRHTIEKADLGGLSTQQEAQGAKIIDQMRDIAMEVANGDGFGHYKREFKTLTKELHDLRHWQPQEQAAPAPAPQPKPQPTPKPAPKPAPAPAPAPKPLEPGAMYKVAAGDYLTKIAREKLGDPNRYKDIIELNKDKYPSLEKNPDLIYPGWMLVLPKK